MNNCAIIHASRSSHKKCRLQDSAIVFQKGLFLLKNLRKAPTATCQSPDVSASAVKTLVRGGLLPPGAQPASRSLTSNGDATYSSQFTPPVQVSYMPASTAMPRIPGLDPVWTPMKEDKLLYLGAFQRPSFMHHRARPPMGLRHPPRRN